MESSARRNKLTPREDDVAKLACAGRLCKEIAFQLGISEQRIKAILTQLYQKTGARNKVELAQWMHRRESGEPEAVPAAPCHQVRFDLLLAILRTVRISEDERGQLVAVLMARELG